MSYLNEKNPASGYTTYAYNPNAPLSSDPNHNNSVSLEKIEKRDLTIKKHIRILRFFSRFLTLILNAIMIGILAFALGKYYLTKNKILPSKQTLWITPTTLWPTFMLLGIAVVSFFMNLLTLFMYCCGVGAANRTNTLSTVVSYILLAVHVIVWAVAAGLFKMANNGKDLWGYTCDVTDEFQQEAMSFADFGKLCNMQGGAWYTSIIESATLLLTFIITFLMMRRMRSKKQLAQARQSMATEPLRGYNREVDTGTEYIVQPGREYAPV